MILTDLWKCAMRYAIIILGIQQEGVVMEIVIDFSSLINLTKLKETILFICKHAHDDPALGAVKLNKLLYYADFKAYRDLGKSITQATYQNLQEGPAPKEFLAARQELLDEDAIKYEKRPYFTHVQKRMTGCREPDLSIFTPQEIGILMEVITTFWEYDATDISELSHLEWGWKLTDRGEDIPYRTAWLSPDPLTQEQIGEGIRLWKELNRDYALDKGEERGKMRTDELVLDSGFNSSHHRCISRSSEQICPYQTNPYYSFHLDNEGYDHA